MFQVPYIEFSKALLVFARMSAMVFLLPIYGFRTVPVQLKAAICVLLTIIVFPVVRMDFVPQSNQPAELLILLTREVIIGLIIGFSATILFYGIQMAGQIVGIQMGYGIVNVVDPMSEVQISLIGQLNYLLALLIFLCLDGHHFLIRALVLSYDHIGLGGGAFSGALVQKMTILTGSIFDIALRIAAPIFVTLFVTDVALGFIARVAPQMNVFIIGFPLKIGVGLLVITLVVSYFPYIFGKLVDIYQADIVEIVRILGK